jgi:hypothetical protein
VFGYDDGNRPYQRPGQDGSTAQEQMTSNGNRGGIFGFIAKMFSRPASSSSSSGYLQPEPVPVDVVLCQTVDGYACHQMEGYACQPVEGYACQPVEGIACEPVEGVTCQPVTLQGH